MFLIQFKGKRYYQKVEICSITLYDQICFLQDADVIVTGDYTGDSIDSSKPSQIMISPNGKVVAISQEKRVNLYSVLNGQLVGSILEPHTQPIVKV